MAESLNDVEIEGSDHNEMLDFERWRSRFEKDLSRDLLLQCVLHLAIEVRIASRQGVARRSLGNF